MHMYVCTHATVHVWRSENNLQMLVLSSYHLDLGNQTHVIRLGSKHHYSQRHLSAPVAQFVYCLLTVNETLVSSV